MMVSFTRLSVALVASAPLALAHQSIFTPSMWGYPLNGYAGEPQAPLGPGLALDDWWFRGPEVRTYPPVGNNMTELPAGGSVTLEIACHIAWTSYGWRTTEPGSPLDACPDNAGAYHTNDYSMTTVFSEELSGCALAIADVDDIDATNKDNLVVFSVQKDCVKQKMTSFEVPAEMPPCSGNGCICAWLWLAEKGATNFYMTAFRCNVTGSPIDATPIAAPEDPVYCGDDASKCVSGAKRPLYAYNEDGNVDWEGNEARAGYHDSWSFTNGPQDDIFVGSNSSLVPAVSASTSKTSNNLSSAGATSTSVVSTAAATESTSATTSAAADSSETNGATGLRHYNRYNRLSRQRRPISTPC